MATWPISCWRVRRLVSEHPELVLQVAESLGWTVKPPEADAARQ